MRSSTSTGSRRPRGTSTSGRRRTRPTSTRSWRDNRTLGIKYFGSGSTPIFPLVYTTEAEWIAYAEYLDALGAQARRHGQTLMVHNHDIEFEIVFGDRTVFDILMDATEPKNVVFQLDLYWAANGGGPANPLDVIARYGNRIKLFQ